MNTSFAASIPGPDGSVPTVVHLPEQPPGPVVLCCHGLLSYKDSPKFVAIGDQFSRSGFAVVRFDFTGCGESRVAPRESLLFSRLHDLRLVLDFVRKQPWADDRIGLLGSSLGGYLALLTAAADPGGIRAVVCWSSPFDLSRIKLGLEEADELKSLFPPGFPLGEPENLQDLPSVSGVLIIHGQEDETVPWAEAVANYRQVAEPKRLLLMKTADHRLLDPHWREMAMAASLEWFLRYLTP